MTYAKICVFDWRPVATTGALLTTTDVSLATTDVLLTTIDDHRRPLATIWPHGMAVWGIRFFYVENQEFPDLCRERACGKVAPVKYGWGSRVRCLGLRVRVATIKWGVYTVWPAAAGQTRADIKSAGFLFMNILAVCVVSPPTGAFFFFTIYSPRSRVGLLRFRPLRGLNPQNESGGFRATARVAPTISSWPRRPCYDNHGQDAHATVRP
jgi:hypothetical protein